MGLMGTIRFRILPYWKTFIVILLPILLLPLPIIGQTQEAKAGYGIIIMAVFWMTEALPLPVTSLLPVVLFPLLGVMSTGRVCPNYMKETNMMFMGGIMVALAVERCNLHQRIALRVLILVGAKPRWLMLGIMLTTMFLSMWISNTSATALMVPIVEAVIQQLFKDDEQVDAPMLPSKTFKSSDLALKRMSQSESAVGLEDASDDEDDQEIKRKTLKKTSNALFLSLAYAANLGGTGTIVGSGTNLIVKGVLKDVRVVVNYHQNLRNCFFMSVAYAANIGGTGTQTGSGPQLSLKEVLHDLYGSGTGLNFATWMAFNIPGMLINTFLAWIWLQFLFIGFERVNQSPAKEKQVNQMIRTQYEELGPMSFQEVCTLVLFNVCVLLWFFRDPNFIPGWNLLFPLAEVDDATPVMLIVMLLFIIPAKPKFWFLRPAGEQGPEVPSAAILDWDFVSDKTPWGIFLLMGAGFALSDASKVSGLSVWLGTKLTSLEVLPPFALMLVICIMTAAVTEVASNTATANIVLPIIAKMAEISHINPLTLMVPVAVTCSYAFMLPVATPPNAIVFAAAKMRPLDMIKAGFLMNFICVVVICTLMITFGDVMFDIYTLPDWALQNVTISTAISMANETSH